MPIERWRIALIMNVAPIALPLVERLRELGHDPVVILTARRPVPLPPELALTDATAPRGVDLVMARDKWSMEPLLRAERPDLAICWGFPWLIPQAALDVPRLGSVNVHPALLPRHRGPIPLAWTIRSGDDHFGVTWHRMDAAFDTGAVLAQAPVPMEPGDADIWIVAPRVRDVALALLPRVLERLAEGEAGDPQVATGDETYAGYFGDDYREIDWSRPAAEIDRQVRAWTLTMGNRGLDGPIATIGGERRFVRRTALADPGGGAIRIETGDGPIWVTSMEPVEGAPA